MVDSLVSTVEQQVVATEATVIELVSTVERELLVDTVREVIASTETALLVAHAEGAVQVLDAAEPFQVLEVAGQGPPGPPGMSADAPTVTFQANGDLGGHRVLRLQGGMARYADCLDVNDVMLVVGISRHAASNGSPITIQTGGLMTEPSWEWEADRPLFCGSNGLLTQTRPEVGFSQILAIAITSTQILIGADSPVVLA